MFPYLEVLVFLPLVGAAAVGLAPRATSPRLFRLAGLVVALAELVVTVMVLVKFKSSVAGPQFSSVHQWIPTFGISWSLGVDGISLVLLLLTAILFPIALFGAGQERDAKAFTSWMLLLEAACIGSFLAQDIFVFFVFFELTLVPSYFLIANWGFLQRGRAAIKFFIYTFLGSAFLLIGMLALVYIHDSQTHVLTFSIAALAKTALSSGTAKVLFLAFSAAFVVKAPIFPFHTWSPDAYANAPTAGVIILSGVMAKLGTYGIIRFDFELFPGASRSLAWVLLSLAVIGIIYGAIVAAGERDLSRLVAYSSMAHMGFIVLGLFAFTSEGVSGAVLQMFNHGIYTAALFLLIGMIYTRRKTVDATQLSGIQSRAPIFAGVFMVVMLASIGLPGFSGFIGEFMILLGGFLSHRWWAVVGASGVVLSAIYLLWAYQRVFHRADPSERGFADMGRKEMLTIAPLILLIVGLGIFPNLLLDKINPSVAKVISSPATAAVVQPVVGGGR